MWSLLIMARSKFKELNKDRTNKTGQEAEKHGDHQSSSILFYSYRKINKHLIIFWGVKLDSHRWFKMAPFHVALNRVSHSDLCSVSEVNPAGPTKIKCWTCSGCCNWHIDGINYEIKLLGLKVDNHYKIYIHMYAKINTKTDVDLP